MEESVIGVNNVKTFFKYSTSLVNFRDLCLEKAFFDGYFFQSYHTRSVSVCMLTFYFLNFFSSFLFHELHGPIDNSESSTDNLRYLLPESIFGLIPEALTISKSKFLSRIDMS